MDITDFPITRKWPARYPERLQLYSLATPNGIKVGVMLEECGLPYEVHKVDFATQDQQSAEFRSLNPYGKIPAILDPNGPDGQPLALFESGAILIYLADKTGRFLAPSGASRYQTIKWLMFQMGGVGPMFGQVGFFYKFAGREWPDKRPLEKYVGEARRVLNVLNLQLADNTWMTGAEYTIADIAIFPWVNNLIGFYGAGELVGYTEFTNLQRALQAFLARPAAMRGLKVPE
jgi:GSH-dependent disulfide-bond oxidoreductase